MIATEAWVVFVAIILALALLLLLLYVAIELDVRWGGARDPGLIDFSERIKGRERP